MHGQQNIKICGEYKYNKLLGKYFVWFMYLMEGFGCWRWYTGFLFCVTAKVCHFRCYSASRMIGGLSELCEYDIRADRKWQ